MLLRQMLWVPRRVPVCVFERSPRSIFRSNLRLIFLGRLVVSPVLFVGGGGYFAYLADQSRFRWAVLSELKRIMSSAGLDRAYYVEDWFMKKGRLFVHVAKRRQQTRRRHDSPSKTAASWLKRTFHRLQQT